MDPFLNESSDCKPDQSFKQLLTNKLREIGKNFGFNEENLQKLSSIKKRFRNNLTFIWNHDKIFFFLFHLICFFGFLSTYLINVFLTSIIVKCIVIPSHLLFNFFCFMYISEYFLDSYEQLDNSSKSKRNSDICCMAQMDPPIDPIKAEEIEKAPISQRLANIVKEVPEKIGENLEKFWKGFETICMPKRICRMLLVLVMIIPHLLIASLFFLLLQYQVSDCSSAARNIAYFVHIVLVLAALTIMITTMSLFYENRTNDGTCSCICYVGLSPLVLAACVTTPLLALVIPFLDFLIRHLQIALESPSNCTLSINGTDVDIYFENASKHICEVLSKAVINETQLITALGYEF